MFILKKKVLKQFQKSRLFSVNLFFNTRFHVNVYLDLEETFFYGVGIGIGVYSLQH